MKRIQMTNWVCYAIGYVFIISGILKLVDSSFKGTFMSIGLPFPEFTLLLVALAELGCGMLIVGRMYMHLAIPPLILIMLGAIYLTKLPVLWTEGFFAFAFNARLDIVMIILLLVVWQHVRATKVTG